MKTMDKEFVPYQQALELKALGFDEPCFGDYFKFEDGQIIIDTDDDRDRIVTDNLDEKIEQIAAPLYQQAFRWFREKYNLHSHISLGTSDEQDRSGLEYDEYIYIIEGLTGLDYDNYGESPFYKTPEEAELACLRKLIEIVKEKKNG